MVDPDNSIFPLLRERRAELRKEVLDADRCFALNEIWLEKLKRRPDFEGRVAQGEAILVSYVEHKAGASPDAAPTDVEPRD